jgi:threonine dehydrogenase-like Zn-dependent dehydrogenase
MKLFLGITALGFAALAVKCVLDAVGAVGTADELFSLANSYGAIAVSGVSATLCAIR